tara:strand:+ start:1802 stop:2740 length:939 start_codon:yes stop_codon:yes gene_type:complete
MNRYSLLFILFFAFISCDDGDVIVTTFDFDDQTIRLCTTAESAQADATNYVFYKINNDTRESLAFEITTEEPILSVPSNGDNYSYTLGTSTNAITYRRYDGDITTDYFCNSVPPANPKVIEEYLSQEGNVSIATSGNEDDNDGILREDEELLNEMADLDGDGIPNYYDFDDDGDNVPTTQEGVEFLEDGHIDMENSRDSDEDGIPDFMDADDDNDGIATVNEDPDGDLNPNNDKTDESIGSDYLNPAIAESYNIASYRPHTYQLRDIALVINLSNLVFENQNSDDVIRQENFYFGEYGTSSVNVTVTPDFPE